MKVVINNCFGGFSLSPAAVQALAELEGKKAYFFDSYGKPLTSKDTSKGLFWIAFDVPEYGESNEFYKEHLIDNRPKNRADPKLIQVIEELGVEKASAGRFAKLKIVEIPDGVDYQIEEYNGIEHITEKHRTWS